MVVSIVDRHLPGEETKLSNCIGVVLLRTGEHKPLMWGSVLIPNSDRQVAADIAGTSDLYQANKLYNPIEQESDHVDCQNRRFLPL